MVHVIWLIVVLLAFAGGVTMGFRIYVGTLGGMQIDGMRAEALRQIQTSLRLIAEDDVAAHRRSEDMMLRSSVVSLTIMPRRNPCTPGQSQAMADARRYIATHPLEAERPYGDMYADGLAYCDKPETPTSPLFFLGF